MNSAYELNKPTDAQIVAAKNFVIMLEQLGYFSDHSGHYYKNLNKIRQTLRCEVDSGCERDVFLVNDIPLVHQWVIKITYRPTTYSHQYIEDNYPWAPSDDEFNDSCRRECFFYKMACEEGIQDAFAASYFYEVHGIGFEMQQFSWICEDDIYQIFSDYVVNQYEIDDPDEIGDYVEGLTGDEALEALFGYNRHLENFCDEYNIGDLHELNCGFDDNENIILVDYAGYH